MADTADRRRRFERIASPIAATPPAISAQASGSGAAEIAAGATVDQDPLLPVSKAVVFEDRSKVPSVRVAKS